MAFTKVKGPVPGVPFQYEYDSANQVQRPVVGVDGEISGGGGGGSGGGASSRAMRTLQRLVHAMPYAKGNNRLAYPEISDFDVEVLESLPGGYTRSYAASVSEELTNIYGGMFALDSGGVRIWNATESATEKRATSGAIEFGVYGENVIVQLEKGGSYRAYVEVNGVDRLLTGTENLEPLSAGDVDGSFEYVRLNFPSRKPWKVTIETGSSPLLAPSGYSLAAGRIGTIYVNATDSTCFKIPKQDLRLCAIADESMDGQYASAIDVLASALGIKDCNKSVVPATGAVNADGANYPWSDRRTDWQYYDPSILIFQLAYADITETDSVHWGAVLDELEAARAANANMLIFVMMYPEVGEGQATLASRNAYIYDAILNMGDPFIQPISIGSHPLTYWLEVGSGDSSDSFTDGPRPANMAPSGFLTPEGQLNLGYTLVDVVSEAMRVMYYGSDNSSEEDAPYILPSSGGYTWDEDTEINVLLGTIYDTTPISVISGAGPAGTTVAIDGQELRITGTPTTPGTTNSTIVISTEGGNLQFALSANVQAVEVEGAIITPSSAEVDLTVGEDMGTIILGVVSGGTLESYSITGAIPAGCSVGTAGQNVRMFGTPTTAGVVAFTMHLTTSEGGEIDFSVGGAVSEAAPSFWIPTDLPNEMGWYVSDEPTNTIISSRLDMVTDKGTTGQNLYTKNNDTNNRADLSPVAPNGRSVWRSKYPGDTNVGHLRTSPPSALARNTGMIVLAQVVQGNDGGQINYLDVGNGYNAKVGTSYDVDASLLIGGGRRTAADGWQQNYTDWDGSWAVAITIFDFANGYVLTRLNGEDAGINYLPSSGLSEDVDSAHLTIGHYSDLSDDTIDGMDGWHAEHIYIKGAVDTDGFQRLEGYLAWEWGLVDLLPSGHPYKTARP